MKYCVDTWFLIEFRNRKEKSIQIVRDTLKGKSRLIIPTVCILEFLRNSIQRGESPSTVDSLLKELKASEKVQFIVLDEIIAKEAAKISISFNIPTVDSIVAATCKLSKCGRLLSNDDDLKKIHNKYIEVECW